METMHPYDLTIGQALGGRLRTWIEQLNLVACNIITQDEVSELLNHSIHQPVTPKLANLLDKLIASTSCPAATTTEASPSVLDLTTMPLEEQRRTDADYLPENRFKLESVILNPYYDPVTGVIQPSSTANHASVENAAPLPTPRLPTSQEAAALNSKYSSSTSATSNAQADHLRRMRQLEERQTAGAAKRS